VAKRSNPIRRQGFQGLAGPAIMPDGKEPAMTTSATSLGGPAALAPRPSLPSERRAAAPAKAPSAKSSNRVLMLLVGLLIVIAVMGTGTAFVFGKGFIAAGRTSTAPAKTGPIYASLPAMNFTFAEGRLMRRMRLKVLLELDPTLQAAQIDPLAPRIVNALNMRMASAQTSDLTGPGATRFVKDVVTVAANRELQPLRVKQVLVQEMLMN
jgi:flagellar protein FliL